MATFTILRKPPNDIRTGDPSTAEPDRIPLPGAFIAPRTSGEPTQRGRTGVVIGHDLFVPHSSVAIRHGDTIEQVDGAADPELYQVDGEAARWTNPFTGVTAGTVAALHRAAG